MRSVSDMHLTLVLEKNAEARCIVLGPSEHKIKIKSDLGANSKLELFGLWKNERNVETCGMLQGEGAEYQERHVFSTDSNLSLTTNIFHKAKSTKSHALVRGVVNNAGVADVSGLVEIEKSCIGCESSLVEKILLLDAKSKARTDPKLEIQNNDVVCRHSASVSQINEDEIFYLMSRGITRAVARSLIIDGFLESAFSSDHTVSDFDGLLFRKYWPLR
jgi:hypothetical protein